MVTLFDHGVILDAAGNVSDASAAPSHAVEAGRQKTMAYRILAAHNHSGDMRHLELKFDSMVSPDNNYVNILQTARASGLTKFPMPYVLSNCHNTLCAVGGTILEDDHAFGLSNAEKFGGIFVPLYRGVLHQYMREKMAGGGKINGIPGNGLNLHVNPASLPVMEDLMRQGIGSELAIAGVTMRPCICGPCFGVTDTPANDQLSIRHVTRNYATREGSKPGQGQMAAVCLMDARSSAATVRNGGRLTAATELTNVEYRNLHPHFNEKIYEHQIYDNYGHADPKVKLVKGPNIADWPEMAPLKEHLLLKVAGSYQGSVTTDELVPSGEASSYRSNPEKISGFTMISRDPQYVSTAKAIRVLEAAPNFEQAPKTSRDAGDPNGVTFGSLMVSDQIGDGSSREQAASCQKVLGGFFYTPGYALYGKFTLESRA